MYQLDSPVVCTICNSEIFVAAMKKRTDEEYFVCSCRECGLVSTFPRPTPQHLVEFYGRTYFEKNGERVGGYEDYSGLPEQNARLMWGEFQRFEPSIANQVGYILDCGCATGGFLDEAQKNGWKCLGVELSEHAVQRARSFGLDILVGDLSHPDLVPRSFNVVTMWHVLEHVISPALVLKQARDLLQPGGHLLIELPNWNSLGRIGRGAKWAQLRPPEHINFFTPKSLANAVACAGFVVKKSVSLYPSMTNRVVLKTNPTLADRFVSLAGSLVSRIGFGGYVRLLAQRVDA
jgi:2-polyprenyl-3-methyl-5-hydroxy-6-metoxy-1,4-benzoquinol methylase/transcription elongation factor Elf1